MGLDMYLVGESHTYGHVSGRFAVKAGEAPPVAKVGETYELGYWRKHANLHGFIVATFAEGVDVCQEIPLTRENLDTIIVAVRKRTLPHTTGFFFGKSDDSAVQRKEDLAILMRAQEWLASAGPNESRSIHYQASW